MAKKKSFDPDALAKAGQEIVSKHQARESITPVQTKAQLKKAKSKKTRRQKEQTQLCRIGVSFHKKAKIAAAQNDMTIRAFLENLIEKDQG